MWTALISGGLSLLSGLGARQSAKKQQKLQAAYEYQNFINRQADIATNRAWTNLKNDISATVGMDYQARANALRERWNPANAPRDAYAAGFNPVTWLNATSGIYGSMLQGAENMYMAGGQLKIPEVYLQESYAQQAPTAQVPSALEVAGNAAQAGFNTFLTDMRAVESRNFQREMLATQIAAIQRNGGRPSSSMGVPAAQRTFFGSGQIPYSVTAGKPAPEVLGNSAWKAENVGVTAPFQNTMSNPNFSDAQTFGQRYGEESWLTTLYGMYLVPQDMMWANNRRNLWEGAAENWRRMTTRGYEWYPDGARGKSWGLPQTYSTGGQF